MITIVNNIAEKAFVCRYININVYCLNIKLVPIHYNI